MKVAITSSVDVQAGNSPKEFPGPSHASRDKTDAETKVRKQKYGNENTETEARISYTSV